MLSVSRISKFMPVESSHPSPHRNGSSPLTSSPSSNTPVHPHLNDWDLGQLLRGIRRRKWLVLGVSIAVASLSWGYTLTRTPIYRGEFRVLVESTAEGDRSRQLLQANPSVVEPIDYSTQLEVLQSPALLEPVALQLQSTYPDLTAATLSQNLDIARLRDTRVLAVSYLDTHPERIQDVLEEVAQHYLRYSFQQRQSDLLQGVQFVEDQLPDLRKRVNTLQVRLERFRQNYSLIDPESRGEDLTGLLSDLEEERQKTAAQLKESQALYRSLQRQVGLNPDEALASSALSESVRYQALLNEVREIETQIAIESARFWPGTLPILALEDKRRSLLPLVRREAQQVLRRLAGGRSPRINGSLTPTAIELSRQLVDTANQVAVLETRSNALREAEQRLREEFSIVPALAREYTDLQRELTIATESLNRFLSTRETLQIEAAQKSVPWELLSTPNVLPRPIAPNVPRNLILGAIAGLVSGAIAAFLAEQLDASFHTTEEIKTLTRLPLLGTIPYVRDLQITPPDFSSVTPQATPEGTPLPLVEPSPVMYPSYSYQTSPLVEAFRSLYANLRFLSSDTPIRSVVISSAVPAEGKSTVSLFLAKTAASLGQRVLLIDADLRRPQLHDRLGLPNLHGLTNAIATPLPLRDVIQRSPHDPTLYVLTAGAIPPDPIKLLSSHRMKTLMEQVERQFDLVIYDMPPLLGFADSSVLAAHTDGVVLVVGMGQTHRTTLLQAMESLTIAPTTILGVVANGLRAHTAHQYEYYHHRYRRYYSQQNPRRFASFRNGVGFTPWRMPIAQGMATLHSLSVPMKLFLLGGISLSAALIYLAWRALEDIVILPQEPAASATTHTSSRSPGERQPFQEAVRLAEMATTHSKTATTQADWFAIANLWTQAADLMSVVPSAHEQYAIARDRVGVYRRNSEYAQKQANQVK